MGAEDDTVIAVYQRHGSVWADLRDDHLVEGSWLDRFCDVLPAGGAVLDIGCGSGIPIARDLIRRGVSVTGLDGSSTRPIGSTSPRARLGGQLRDRSSSMTGMTRDVRA